MMRVEIRDGDNLLTTEDFKLQPKEFKTGSRGFHTHGKLEFEGKRFQANLLLVEIGSKPKPE